MKAFLIFFVTITVASAAVTHNKRSTYEANLNTYVDKVITNLQAWIVQKELNDVALPNVTQSFSVKPGLITYSGRLSLFDGVLSNIASITRYGDVTLSYADRVLQVSANLGVDTINIAYTYQAKLLGITNNGAVDGTANTIDTTTSVAFDTSAYEVALNSFTVNSIGTVSASLSGSSSLLEMAANAILDFVISIIKTDVTTGLEEKVTTAIDGYLEEINTAIAAVMG